MVSYGLKPERKVFEMHCVYTYYGITETDRQAIHSTLTDTEYIHRHWLVADRQYMRVRCTVECQLGTA